jgi:hypothetical protein
MIVYPLDFHRRAEQKWARRLKSEVSFQGPISSGNVPRKRCVGLANPRPAVQSENARDRPRNVS